MKTYLLIISCIITGYIKSQSLCSPPFIPTELFPSNSINNSTSFDLRQYLCGPNTTLYDTVPALGRQIYVENNCSLIFRPSSPATDQVWLKSTSTLTLLDGGGSSDLYVYYEPGAIINQTTATHTYSMSVIACSSIVYPSINCVTGIKENTNENNPTISPNPSNGDFIINSLNEIKKIEISNVAGQLLFLEYNISKNPEIHLNNFDNSIYFVKIIYNNGINVTKKIIVN
jgi:hypothetical protein